MTREQSIRFFAHQITVNVVLGPLVLAILIIFTEPWTNWNLLLLISALLLGTCAYVKLLPYSKWLAIKLQNLLTNYV